MVPTEGVEAKLEAFVTLRKPASWHHEHSWFCIFATWRSRHWIAHQNAPRRAL